MSANNKPPSVRAGQPEPELSKLKALWRRFAEDTRAYWRERLISGGEGNTQPEIRRDIATKLKVRLEQNSQLSNFKQWMLEQDQMDAEAERADEEERRIQTEHPDWTKEQVREDLLKRFYNRARATGDSALGLATIAADARMEALQLDRDKFEFDAAKSCLARLPELKAVSEKKMSDDEKAKAIQQILFPK